MNLESLNRGIALALLAGMLAIPIGARGSPETITLGSGRLDAGAIGVFSFSLASAVQGGDTLAIHTNGSAFDTEIALYDASGRLVASNDNVSARNLLSRLRFGGTQALAAGNYFAIVSGFNTLFRDGDVVPGNNPGGAFRLELETTQPAMAAVLPSYRAHDGNHLPGTVREVTLGQGVLGSGSVARFDFTLGEQIAEGGWLVIHTTGTDFDTEIGLYDAAGRLVASNDNVTDRNLLSRLSFGLDGDNGRNLPAGNYTLMLGGFNTSFQDGWAATSSFSRTGSYAVHLQSSSAFIAQPLVVTSPVPEPSASLMLLVGLALLFGLRRHVVNRGLISQARSFTSANGCFRIETLWHVDHAHQARPILRNQALA